MLPSSPHALLQAWPSPIVTQRITVPGIEPDQPVPYDHYQRVVVLSIEAFRRSGASMTPSSPPSPSAKPTFAIALSFELTPTMTVIELLHQIRAALAPETATPAVAARGFVTDITADRRALLLSCPSYLVAAGGSGASASAPTP